jgi:hypothetical protein
MYRHAQGESTECDQCNSRVVGRVGRVGQQALTSVQLDLQVGEIVGVLLHELTHVPEATHGTIVCELGIFVARFRHRFPATADTFLL